MEPPNGEFSPALYSLWHPNARVLISFKAHQHSLVDEPDKMKLCITVRDLHGTCLHLVILSAVMCKWQAQKHNQDQAYFSKIMCVTLLQVLQKNQQITFPLTKKRVWLCSGLFILLKMNCGVKNPQIAFNPSIFSLIGISFPSLWKSETWYDRTHFPKVPSNQMQRQLNCWLHFTQCLAFFPSYIVENLWEDREVSSESTHFNQLLAVVLTKY